MKSEQKKRIAGIIAGILAGAILQCGVYWILRSGFGVDIFDRSGWNSTETGVQYLDYHGKPLTGWQTIDGMQFYFAPPDGLMLTGWQEIDNARYYLGVSGIPYTGWQTVDGITWLFDDQGRLCTGWQEQDGNRYYLDAESGLLTGFFQVENNTYFADATGVILTGWQETGSGVIYLDANGVLQTGWQEQGGNRYYLKPESGAVTCGKATIEGKLYYFDDTGILQTGWQEIDGSRHYLHEDGTVAVGWTDIGKHRYYFTEEGLLCLGWQMIDGDKYYFKDNGVMAIGQITLDGVNHFFTSQGKYVLLVNPWNPVPEDYPYDFVDYNGRKVDRSAYEALKQMVADGRAAGNPCSITEIYRSVDVQRYLWNRRKTAYMEEGYDAYTADMMTGWSVAIPGHSEHQTGLALDFNRDEPGTLRWMRQHCWEYGFIVRYPDGKMDYTGIVYESWHFRYVGKELAQELKELDMCMEEYMEMLTNQEKGKGEP